MSSNTSVPKTNVLSDVVESSSTMPVGCDQGYSSDKDSRPNLETMEDGEANKRM